MELFWGEKEEKLILIMCLLIQFKGLNGTILFLLLFSQNESHFQGKKINLFTTKVFLLLPLAVLTGIPINLQYKNLFIRFVAM